MADADARLQMALTIMGTVHDAPVNSPAFIKWHRDTKVALRYIFGESSNNVQEFEQIRYSPRNYAIAAGGTVETDKYRKAGLERARAVLESMLREVMEYWSDSPNTPALPQGKPATNKVFIVHGHDAGMKETVARFLQCLKLEPVILHEQPNEGKTIIEKFEKHSDVAFAVVLLSGDDIGGRRGDAVFVIADAERRLNLRARARQNVILELGFFFGRLGRERVCPLVKAGVEIPSDYDGVVYVPFDDAGAWKQELFRELKAAGFNIDANKMFKAGGA
jgi:predicted nucleotide-binding protein